MATTHELIEQYDALLCALEDAEAANDEDRITVLVEQIDRWHLDDLPAKVEALLAYADHCKALAAECADKAKEWQAAGKRRAARGDRCKQSAVRLLDLNGGPVDMAGGRRAHVVERKSVSVSVSVPVEELPFGFRAIKTSADKTAIKKALQAGSTVPGCALVEGVSRRVSVKDS